MRYRIYRNLHKHCWSIQAFDHEYPFGQQGPKGRGRWVVVAHADEVWLRGPIKFTVHASGRERVRREGRKYVHAYIEGTDYSDVRPQWAPPSSGLWWEQVTYDPYVDNTFQIFDPWVTIDEDEDHDVTEVDGMGMTLAYFSPKGKVLVR